MKWNSKGTDQIVQMPICCLHTTKSCPKVMKLLSCSTQQSIQFVMLINVKMTTIVGILSFNSMIIQHLRV